MHTTETATTNKIGNSMCVLYTQQKCHRQALSKSFAARLKTSCVPQQQQQRQWTPAPWHSSFGYWHFGRERLQKKYTKDLFKSVVVDTNRSSDVHVLQLCIPFDSHTKSSTFVSSSIHAAYEQCGLISSSFVCLWIYVKLLLLSVDLCSNRQYCFVVISKSSS